MSETIVKKIKPYPIPCEIQNGDEKYLVQILRLEQIGFIIEDDRIQWNPPVRCSVRFILPVQRVRVDANAMLVKVTNSLMRDPNKKVHKRLEFNFLDLLEPYSKQIKAFCEKINQK